MIKRMEVDEHVPPEVKEQPLNSGRTKEKRINQGMQRVFWKN